MNSNVVWRSKFVLVGSFVFLIGSSLDRVQAFEVPAPSRPSAASAPLSPVPLAPAPEKTSPEKAPPETTTQAAWKSLSQSLAALALAAPTSVESISPAVLEQLGGLSKEIENNAADVALFEDANTPAEYVASALHLADALVEVDRISESLWNIRGECGALGASPEGRAKIRLYLKTNGALVDLSSRLRYLLFDAIRDAAYEAAFDRAAQDALIAGIAARKCDVGARILCEYLIDAPKGDEDAMPAMPVAAKANVLALAGASGERSLIPTLAKFTLDEATPAELVIWGAAALRSLGLPQDARPGQDAELPQPAITARAIAGKLAALDLTKSAASYHAKRDELRDWARNRARAGVQGDRFRLGDFDVAPGDWLLMRNPSPYNLFTDLAPGLFTHVGVITDETGSDGIRRFVLVDLPEAGKQIDATNLDAFVQRTLHFAIVRHPDPQVAAKMAAAARSIIGNPSVFDLNFRTDRLEEYRTGELAGRKIQTYCAGLLLLCADRSTAPRSDFFPVGERSASGLTSENLAQLGLSIGENFASPTGALFSPKLKLVGRRAALYDPSHEVEEAVFNHFAVRLAEKPLHQSPDTAQSLRLKVAESARTNPLLAQALASAAGVSVEMDLVSAAKAGAVVETLDDTAYSSSAAYRLARQAVAAGPEANWNDSNYDDEQKKSFKSARAAHADLVKQWEADELTPRELRQALVSYYSESGKRRIDERFFNDPNQASTPATGAPTNATP